MKSVSRLCRDRARLALATSVATVPACSIWAAIDNPYKNDAVIGGAGDAAAAPDGLADSDAREAAPGRRIVDAGFIPYAIAVHDDTVYAVDNQARIYEARDATTRFTRFWTGDGGDTFLLQTNAIAASSAGVFWTVAAGVHLCSADAGACAFIPSSTVPRAIAAGGTVVAWIDGTGVRACTTTSVTGCTPATLPSSRGAASIAVGSGGTVAWTDGGRTIRFDDGQDSGAITLRYDVSLLASDDPSDNLYWAGLSGLGFVPFDGGVYPDAFQLTSLTKPIELFAAHGLVSWSLRAGNGVVEYCRFDSDAGCTPRPLANGLLPLTTTNQGIVANSRVVLAIVSSDMTYFDPVLLAWPLPN